MTRHRPTSHAEAVASHRWDIPQQVNIASQCLEHWARTAPERIAILTPEPGTSESGETAPARALSFAGLDAQASAIARQLRADGITAGDRVAVRLAQSAECAAAFLGVLKLGAVLCPIAPVFKADGVAWRLRHTAAKALLSDAPGLAELTGAIPAGCRALDIAALLAAPPGDSVAAHPTRASDPAMICYAAAGAGEPLGTVLPHSVVHGSLPGVLFAYDYPDSDGDDVFWTPADWSFIAGSLCVLFPALSLGRPVVAQRAQKFDAASTFQLIQDLGITTMFLPPTAGRMLREDPTLGERYRLRVRAVASGGEPFTADIQDWAERVFGTKFNDFYGQTECNAAVVTNHRLMEAKPFKMGLPAPGRVVEVLRADGTRADDGEKGLIAVKAPDPVMLLEYWQNPQETARKIMDGWLWTGDYGVRHEDGYLSWAGRQDDVITTAGYRVGPKEVETCLETHPAVARACVFGIPDAARTEAVAAWVELAADAPADHAQVLAELTTHVRTRLGAHEYPRQIRIVTAIPMADGTGGPDRRAARAAHLGGQGA